MKKTLIGLIALIAIITQSCTPKITSVDTSCPTYKYGGFNVESINMDGVAIMPILGGNEKEAYRRPMGNEMYNQMKLKYDKVLSPYEVIDYLNQENLIKEYNDAILQYQVTAIISKKLLIKLNEALNVRYLLYTRLMSNNEIEILYTGYYSMYTKLQTNELFVECQIWDTNLGDVVWEGKGGFAALESVNVDYVTQTAIGLVNILGNEIGDGSCESPKRIMESVSSAVTGTWLSVTAISLGLSLLILLAL